jgi:hypothetical protein
VALIVLAAFAFAVLSRSRRAVPRKSGEPVRAVPGQER